MSEAKAPRVRVFVADDHPVYREGVARAIKARPEFELIGEAEDGRLPAAARLLDLLALEDPTPQAVAARWAAGPSTAVVIGAGTDGPFAVDLRRDGPHGLVAVMEPLNTRTDHPNIYMRSFAAGYAVARGVNV